MNDVGRQVQLCACAADAPEFAFTFGLGAHKAYGADCRPAVFSGERICNLAHAFRHCGKNNGPYRMTF